MKALDRLKNIEDEYQPDAFFEIPPEDAAFLFKAFKLMREIALGQRMDVKHVSFNDEYARREIDFEFEKRMKQE